MIVKPEMIEQRSFEIITSELGDVDICDELLPLVKRVIHTTADFEYAKILKFNGDVISSASSAIKAGCKIYSDTKMILSGVNKKVLNGFGADIYTYIDDVDVASLAIERGVTRSIVGMEKAAKDINTKIFIIGNAPTALFTLIDMINNKQCKPELIIGVPVGFVGAAESKEALETLNIPYILTRGRKGGSTVAVGLLNAILYGMKNG